MSTLTFTLIQSNLYWEDKKANLAMFEKKILSINEKTEVVVLPEMFNTGFSMRPVELCETMDGETVAWMRRIAAEKKVILVGSLIIAETENDSTAYYNRLIWMLPNGQYGKYDKRHRFGYGGEDREFAAGNSRLIASVKGWKVNLLVCYDLRFPVWARQQSQDEGAEYDVLVYVANWPERRSHAWRTLLQARAIENQCYVVGVNRIGDDGHGIHHGGDSMAVDALGTVLYQKAEAEDTFTITLDKKPLDEIREKLPFLQDADHFMLMPEE